MLAQKSGLVRFPWYVWRVELQLVDATDCLNITLLGRQPGNYSAGQRNILVANLSVLPEPI